jgi:uncharacterized protein DUF6789
MSDIAKGLVGGLVATTLLSVLMILNSSFGLVPELSFIRLLTALGTLTVPSAWMDHFIVGVVVWGLLFTGFNTLSSRPALWAKGMIFGVFAWLFMMVAFMPLAGAGFFGAKVGGTVVFGFLVLHLIYGAVLGATFGLLGVWVPVRIPVIAPTDTALTTPDGFTLNSADINDHLPSSSPSGRTVMIFLGTLVGLFALLVLILELRKPLGF